MVVLIMPVATMKRDACIASPGYTSSSVTNGDGTVSITYSVQHPLQATDFCEDLVLPQFEPAPGTLQSADLAYGLSAVSQATIVNGAPQLQSFR